MSVVVGVFLKLCIFIISVLSSVCVFDVIDPMLRFYTFVDAGMCAWL